MTAKKRRLFVIMPFGKRAIDIPALPSELDFDAVYRELIVPAGRLSEFDVLRIDELDLPGRISDQYLRQLYTADVVLGDISAPNANVFYEVGIRQAMNTGPTVLIAAGGANIPFDLREQRIFFYDAIAPNASLNQLRRLLQKLDNDRGRNPVQEFLRGYGVVPDPQADVAGFEQEFRARIGRARNADQLIGVWGWAQHFSRLPPFALLDLADSLANVKEWSQACEVIRRALEYMPSDYELHRKQGWYFRNRGTAYYGDAERSFRRALELNSKDPETIGMLAGLLKRQERFEESAELYARGAELSPNNLYMRVNNAATIILGSPTDPAAGISLYSQLYRELTLAVDEIGDEWSELVCGEAAFVMGDVAQSKKHFSRAHTLATSPNRILSPADQIELFGQRGFRTDDARAMASWLRSFPHQSECIQSFPVTKGYEEARLLPVVIHLSDIHFGTKASKDGTKVRMHRFVDGDYSLSLLQHMRNEFKDEKSYFHFDAARIVLVVSGDLTYTASQDEFEEARSFLDSMCADLGIAKDRVIICPGNHDVDWLSSGISPTRRFDNYLSFLRAFYGKPLFERLYPLIKWDFTVSGKRPLPTDIVSAVKVDDLGIQFVSLNSCVYETPEHHYGFVSGKQIRSAEKLIQEFGLEKTFITCAAVHHHLHPYPEPVVLTAGDEHWHDQSTIRDGALLERFLERGGFDLVFHGHKHKAQLRETVVRDPLLDDDTPPLIVCGAGSCGVDSKELEHGIPNQYEVLEFLTSRRKRGAEFIRLDWREIAVTSGADWTTTKRWILMG